MSPGRKRCMADETVSGEPVSEADFSANREIYREVDKIL
jgi:hypothetical protein